MGLHPSFAALVYTGKDGLELYVDAVGRVIRQEAWQESGKSVVQVPETQKNSVQTVNPF